MKNKDKISGYTYTDSKLNQSHGYLLPALNQIIDSLDYSISEKKLFDLGCGNGSVANYLYEKGWEVTGIDPSNKGIDYARRSYPHLNLYEGSAYDDLAEKYGAFPVVISLEVVEHVYDPRHFAKTLFELVDDGGIAIVSTPYHSYIKNLVIALSGKMDGHFTALWDHGHIKFWSFATLTTLLKDAGFKQVRFERVGRIPPLAKSMIAIASK